MIVGARHDQSADRGRRLAAAVGAGSPAVGCDRSRSSRAGVAGRAPPGRARTSTTSPSQSSRMLDEPRACCPRSRPSSTAPGASATRSATTPVSRVSRQRLARSPTRACSTRAGRRLLHDHRHQPARQLRRCGSLGLHARAHRACQRRTGDAARRAGTACASPTVYSPKWKIDAASTASACPSASPSAEVLERADAARRDHRHRRPRSATARVSSRS